MMKPAKPSVAAQPTARRLATRMPNITCESSVPEQYGCHAGIALGRSEQWRPRRRRRGTCQGS
eukprot:3700744-Prymnesium_polylepis.2